MNDVLNFEWVNDNLKTFDEALENILMTMEKAPDDDLLEGLDHRRLEKSTSMQTASALCHSGQICRKVPKSFLKLKAIGVTCVQRPAAKFLPDSETKRLGERHRNPSHHTDYRK